ncbi:hypothetical protein [Frigoriglobus tundricola]|uniref:Uncharacterized protein n=1 Tax=Frigoriglobus tundricola TaxID=2774151 RepID=A0A6M5YG07_9BACT|nr:hypothetical protein [Frigoriglobus tundricola]QJW92945.1 hypothetical protein FTUN_0443 [Frigoriglobus tundricola]
MTHAKKNDGARRLKAVRRVMRRAGAKDETRIEPFVLNGHTLYLRTLNAERQAAISVWREANNRDVTGLLLRLVAASVVDAAGRELLTPATAADLPANVARAIITEIEKRNGWGG